MFLEPSEKTGHYIGAGPHAIGEFYVPTEADSGGTIEFKIGGHTDAEEVISGRYAAWFKRVSGDVDAGGLTAMQALVAPLGCALAVGSSGGYVRLYLTEILGLDADIAVRADAFGGP